MRSNLRPGAFSPGGRQAGTAEDRQLVYNRAVTSRDALAGKTVVVGVSGGIAAYKCAEVVRLLTSAGALVRVAMTASATEFVGPLTFQALSGHPVFQTLFDLSQESEIGHIQLADAADLIIVAPATANTLARLAAGMADDPVTALCLATRAPILLAPSMNVNMWEHPLTQENLRRLVEVAKMTTVGPGDGALACRWTGAGRLAEAGEIVEAARRLLSPRDLGGVRVVVTAGGTREAIDPVRFLGNRSSGKMGFALATAALRRGAAVTLVSAPGSLAAPAGAEHIEVESAAEMAEETWAAADSADVVIMAAAVADHRPRERWAEKQKKGAGGETRIELVETTDILAELGSRRRGGRPLLVGFAAETSEVLRHAEAKLLAKGCDLIVANDVSAEGAGFAVDTNRVALLSRVGPPATAAGTKLEVADFVLDAVVRALL